MPKLYLNLIEADENDFMLGQPIAMVVQGTAEEVADLCEFITLVLKKFGFEIGGKT